MDLFGRKGEICRVEAIRAADCFEPCENEVFSCRAIKDIYPRHMLYYAAFVISMMLLVAFRIYSVIMFIVFFAVLSLAVMLVSRMESFHAPITITVTNMRVIVCDGRKASLISPDHIYRYTLKRKTDGTSTLFISSKGYNRHHDLRPFEVNMPLYGINFESAIVLDEQLRYLMDNYRSLGLMGTLSDFDVSDPEKAIAQIDAMLSKNKK